MYCEVRKSKIHGNGVFAIKDIPKNTKICIYDGYIISNDQKTTDEENLYSMHSADGETLIGYKIPKNPIGIAQIINDGSFFEPTGDFNELTDKIMKYYIQNQFNSNAKFLHDEKKKYVYVKTIRDVKKNEEILARYDFSYWLSLGCCYHNKKCIHTRVNNIFKVSEQMVMDKKTTHDLYRTLDLKKYNLEKRDTYDLYDCKSLLFFATLEHMKYYGNYLNSQYEIILKTMN